MDEVLGKSMVVRSTVPDVANNQHVFSSFVLLPDAVVSPHSPAQNLHYGYQRPASLLSTHYSCTDQHNGLPGNHASQG